jgi:hypothetical protein
MSIFPIIVTLMSEHLMEVEYFLTDWPPSLTDRLDVFNYLFLGFFRIPIANFGVFADQFVQFNHFLRFLNDPV